MKKFGRIGVLAAAVLVALAVGAGSVTAQFPLPPQPSGACLFKDGSCEVIPQNLCKLSKGRWLGPDTTCP